MRQMIGHSDSTKIGKYKVIGESKMESIQSNTQQGQVFKKPKRFRSAFTTEQINYLENQYRKFPYINKDQRKKVATVLQIGERSVKIWFQNRRMREKKENHKEFDDETSTNKEIGKYQLNNVPAPPSTNYQRLYSLPILPSTADTMVKVNTNDIKVNKNDNKEKLPTKTENNREPECAPTLLKKPNYYKEVSNQEHLSPYFYTSPTTNITSPFASEMKYKRLLSQECKSTSAEFSINLCKKYKQECSPTKIAACGNIDYEGRVKKKVERQTIKKDTKYYSSQDFPTVQNSKVSPYPSLEGPNQVDLNNSPYYPVMPSLYAPPLISSGGVLWKPVNFMPVMATNTPVATTNHHGSTTHEQSKNCKCNCHGSTQHMPITLPPNIHNPYAQYVITVPFSHTSPKY